MRWIEFMSPDQGIRHELTEEFEWMRKYAYSYYRKFLSDTDGAEDFSHDVLEKFIERLQEKDQLNRAYFKRMVRFAFLDMLRLRKRDALGLRSEEMGADSEAGPEQLIDTLSSFSKIPEQEVEFRDDYIKRVVDDVIRQNMPLHQQIILQRMVGVSSREISVLLGKKEIDMTVNNVNVIYHKFRTLVKEQCLKLELHPE